MVRIFLNQSERHYVNIPVIEISLSNKILLNVGLHVHAPTMNMTDKESGQNIQFLR